MKGKQREQDKNVIGKTKRRMRNDKV